MLDGLFMLLVLSVVMALSCFLAGALPLSMTLSSAQLRLISTIGMGVLVGTSLIVIIPEGIEAIYSAGPTGHLDVRRNLPILTNSVEMRWAAEIASPLEQTIDDLERREHIANILLSERDDTQSTATPTSPGTVEETTIPEKPKEDPSSDEEHHKEEAPTFFIGLALILGFILMFLIDKLPRHASENLQPPPPTRHISLDNLSRGLHSSSTISADDIESESFLQSLTPSPKQTRSLATTTGLVIHACADGIAMGASASTSNSSLGFVIFIAILIHKAPAAFGLTSVLLKQGLSKRAARGHLIIFSLASPVGALSTWLIVNIAGGSHMAGPKGQWYTGMLLLFSAGTFLYVAMHSMQEDGNHEHSHTTPINGFNESGGPQRNKPKPQMRDTFAAVAGMLLPLLTQFGHHH